MHLDRMRVERFLKVEHPVGAPRLYRKFKIRNEAGKFFHATIGVLHQSAVGFVTGKRRKEFIGSFLGCRELIHDTLRVHFVFRQNALGINVASAAVLLAGDLLANLHKEPMQSLFGFIQFKNELFTFFPVGGIVRGQAGFHFMDKAVLLATGGD